MEIDRGELIENSQQIWSLKQLRRWCEMHFYSYSIYIENNGSVTIYVPKHDYAQSMTTYLEAIRHKIFKDGVEVRIKKMNFWSLFKVYFLGGT